LRAAAAVLIAAAALVAAPASAQEVDTATAQAQASVLTPGSVAKTADMNFGKIAQSSTAGTVVLAPAAAATCTASGTLVRTGICRAARFSIYGRKNNKVRIRQNNGGMVTLNGPGGATMFMDNMTVGVVGMSASGNGNGWDFGNWKIDTANGVTEFFVGGTLHVGAAQAPGVYNGTLLIQIQFN
jgi:hypothetical protein